MGFFIMTDTTKKMILQLLDDAVCRARSAYYRVSSRVSDQSKTLIAARERLELAEFALVEFQSFCDDARTAEIGLKQ